MPIYEYECRECGHRLEALQKLSEEPLVDCPECGQAALTRLVSAAGFRLKGGGWYETDFKKDKRRNVVDSDKGGGEGKSGGGSDSSSGQSDSGSSQGSQSKPASGAAD